MTNAVLEALKAALGLVAGLLPEKWAGLVRMIQGLLNMFNFPASDPRTERVAGIVAELLRDIGEAMKLDATAQERARLVIENRALRAIVELTPGSGI
ncbi:MAG: hypothetical protein WDA03_10760 [Trueperaceae bacterium]